LIASTTTLSVVTIELLCT